MTADNRLSLEQPDRRIADEQLGVAAIDPWHFRRLVAMLHPNTPYGDVTIDTHAVAAEDHLARMARPGPGEARPRTPITASSAGRTWHAQWVGTP
jgi:hypothetical protein